jgi:hypothetical protein
MIKELPPYVNATGTLKKVFDKIKEASVPPRFTQDFISTKLAFPKSGSTMSMIPYLKKIGFIGSDGSPTELYEKFRNPDEKIAGLAIAKAMKIGYPDLYERNEYFHTLDKTNLKSFLIEATGIDAKNSTLMALVGTIEILKSLANFEAIEEIPEKKIKIKKTGEDLEYVAPIHSKQQNAGLNISYTINLNLPETSDPTVFDAIFRSLKEHILSDGK